MFSQINRYHLFSKHRIRFGSDRNIFETENNNIVCRECFNREIIFLFRDWSRNDVSIYLEGSATSTVRKLSFF